MSSLELQWTEVHASRLSESLRRPEVLDATVLALFSAPERPDRESFVGLRLAQDARACPACSGAGEAHSEDCRGAVYLLRRPDGSVVEPSFDEEGMFRGVRLAPRERQQDWAGQLLDLFRSEPREPAFLQAAVHLMRDLLRCRYGAVGIVEEGALVQFLVSGLGAEEIAAIGAAPRGRGLLGLVLRTGEALRIGDIATHPLAEGFPGRHPPMRTLMIVPISSGSEVYGRLYFCDRIDRQPFDAQDEQRASALAALMARLVGLQRHVRTISELDERLRELERVELSARMAAEAAHDLANVLSAVSGYCELLHAEPSTTLRRSYVTGIELAVSRAIDLVRSVLRVARGQREAGATLDLASAAESLAPLLRAVLGKNVELGLEIEPQLPPLAVEASELEMALLNLALNSKTAMPHGGTLTLRARSARTSPGAGSEVLIEVADTGPGFDDDALEEAQAPEGPRRTARNGLGLRSVRRFVEQAGGTLEIAPNVGRGALVRLRLPCPASLAAPGEKLAAGATEALATGHGSAVLLCASVGEDEGHCDHLADYGLGSLCAESIDVALERLRSAHSKLLIVLAEGDTPAREHVEALSCLPEDITLAVLSDRPARHGALARLEGRATFLDRTMSATAVSAELRRLLSPPLSQDGAARRSRR